jgi:hypothetical protein
MAKHQNKIVDAVIIEENSTVTKQTGPDLKLVPEVTTEAPVLDGSSPAPQLPAKSAVKSFVEIWINAQKEMEACDVRKQEMYNVSSEAVKTIYGLLKTNGPFRFNGEELTISHKGDKWFFKANRKTVVSDLD